MILYFNSGRWNWQEKGMSNLEIREYKNSDMNGINVLFNNVFKWLRSDREWSWKFLENPHGDPLIIVAETGGRIVGHYALLPRKIQCFGNDRTAYQEVDLMIDPDYKKGGLFRKLGEVAYREAINRGAMFTFGFPNQTSLPLGTRILKWRAIGKIPLYTLLLNPLDVLDRRDSKLRIPKPMQWPVTACTRRILQTKFHSDIHCSESDRIPVGVVNQFKTVAIPKEFTFERDESYLNWRYQGESSNQYRILIAGDSLSPQGCAVLSLTDDNNAYFCEFWLDHIKNYDAARCLIGYAVDISYSLGCSALRMWTMENSRHAGLLSKMGFLKRESKIYHVIHSFLAHEQNRRLWDPDRWFITIGDSDCI
jgi:predicted N-acetyltransferase YhbS